MKIGYDAKRIFHNTTGLGNYSRDIVRILADKYEADQYYLYNPKRGKVSRLKVNSLMKVCYPKTAFWQKMNSLWRQRWIVKDLVADKIEIYHGLTNELPRGVQNTNIKSVVTIHDLIFVRYPQLYSFFDRKIHFNKFKYAANTADKIIAISEQTKEDIITYLKVPEEKIQVLYQGCHQAFKTNYTKEQKQKVITKFHLPEEFILNVGTIEARKNLMTLVKAIHSTDKQLVVVGKETKYTEKVKSYISEHHLERQVQFLSGVSMEELAIIYQQASLFVYPSIFEGFGIPIIEALYSKTPVISSRGSCFTEAGGPNSIYVDAYDVDELKNQIDRVLLNKNLQEQMIESGIEFVQKFNDDTIAMQMMDLYQNL